MKSTLDSKVVELTEKEMLSVYITLGMNEKRTEELNYLLEVKNTYENLGFRFKYYLNSETGIISYNMIMKNKVGF